MVTSKHQLLADDLAEKIHHGLYQPGDYLPSESQLCSLYGAARGTIRQALGTLAERGIIQRVWGKGSVVLDPGRYTFPVTGLTSFAELNRSLKMRATTRVLEDELRPAPASYLDVAVPPQEASYLLRLRLVDGEPVVVDEDYFLGPAHPVPKAVAADSVYHYLEAERGLKIGYANKVITVEPAGKKVAAALKLKASDLVVVVRANVYLEDTTLFQLNASYHRADRFRFTDFARRKS